MKTALFYDTETTGLPLFNEPSEDPRQPHIIQLAAYLVNLDTWHTCASIDLTIRPEGWEIPDEVAAIHGINTELAMSVGIPESQALSIFLALWRITDYRIAHNEPFDARIIRIAAKRFPTETDPDDWKEGLAECTAKLATPIMKLPPTARMLAAKRNHPKIPTLTEAYEHFTNQKMENAHSAMADVKACLAVYRSIKTMEFKQIESKA
jgi:DNA polymerase-3 subunit epsilon